MGNFPMFAHIKYGGGCTLAINTHIDGLVTEAGTEMWGDAGSSPWWPQFIFVIVILHGRVKRSAAVINSLMTNACNGWPAPNGSKGKGVQISSASVERHLLPKPCTWPERLLFRIRREYIEVLPPS